jgi:hypothetical protein
VLLALHGFDTMQAGARSFAEDTVINSFTHEFGVWTAKKAGVTNKTEQQIVGLIFDAGIPVVLDVATSLTALTRAMQTSAARLGSAAPSPSRLAASDRWERFCGLTSEGRARARQLARDLGFENVAGQTVIKVGRTEGLEAVAERISALTDSQLMELSEYFAVEVSQTVLEGSNGARRAVVRLGVRDNVRVEVPSIHEEIVDVVHTHPGHTLLEATGETSMVSPRLSSPADTNAGFDLGRVPIRTLSRNFENRAITSTTALPMMVRLPE